MTLWLPLSFAVLYLTTGYFSLQVILHYANSGHAGMITDIGRYLVAPLFCALLWLLVYLAGWWGFRKIALLSVAKEAAFQTLFFLANIACLAGVAGLSVAGQKAALNDVPLVPVDVTDFAWVYVVAAAITLILFALIRRKWA